VESLLRGTSPVSVGSSGELAEIIAECRDGYETAQDLVLASVRLAILRGVLEPGTKLRQEELAEVFGTSRIPIREALRALEYEGLVRSEPHRGFTVTALDAEDVVEVYDLRIVLESHAVRLALPLLTSQDLDDLERLFQEMQGAASPDDQLAAREQFYQRLYSVTGRPRLVNQIVRLQHEVARILRWATIHHSGEIHENFFEAVRVGDADRAVEHLSSHYLRVAVLIRRDIREAEARDRTSRRVGRRLPF
jgi:DNA-binding GntR family transcriptional regulator